MLFSQKQKAYASKINAKRREIESLESQLSVSQSRAVVAQQRFDIDFDIHGWLFDQLKQGRNGQLGTFKGKSYRISESELNAHSTMVGGSAATLSWHEENASEFESLIKRRKAELEKLLAERENIS